MSWIYDCITGKRNREDITSYDKFVEAYMQVIFTNFEMTSEMLLKAFNVRSPEPIWDRIQRGLKVYAEKQEPEIRVNDVVESTSRLCNISGECIVSAIVINSNKARLIDPIYPMCSCVVALNKLKFIRRRSGKIS
jgi:hypothetical protein